MTKVIKSLESEVNANEEGQGCRAQEHSNSKHCLTKETEEGSENNKNGTPHKFILSQEMGQRTNIENWAASHVLNGNNSSLSIHWEMTWFKCIFIWLAHQIDLPIHILRLDPHALDLMGTWIGNLGHFKFWAALCSIISNTSGNSVTSSDLLLDWLINRLENSLSTRRTSLDRGVAEVDKELLIMHGHVEQLLVIFNVAATWNCSDITHIESCAIGDKMARIISNHEFLIDFKFLEITFKIKILKLGFDSWLLELKELLQLGVLWGHWLLQLLQLKVTVAIKLVVWLLDKLQIGKVDGANVLQL